MLDYKLSNKTSCSDSLKNRFKLPKRWLNFTRSIENGIYSHFSNKFYLLADLKHRKLHLKVHDKQILSKA